KYSLERQLKMDIHPEISIINLEGGEQEFAKL
ncbi:TPA: NifU family protein, partial [Campylobacter upsaliensis]|nr:NifU family protein [Campylobacter upsaliensis]